MTKWMTRALGGVAVLAALLAGGVGAAGAEPLERERYSFQESDTFTDTECGAPITIDYAAEFSGLFKLKQGRAGDPTPYFFDNYSGVETFTNVANGKTFTLLHQGLFKDQHIQLVEGTVYRITAIETGRPVTAIAPDGTKINLDRGRIRYTFSSTPSETRTRATMCSSATKSLTWLALIRSSSETPTSATFWTRFAELQPRPLGRARCPFGSPSR
jgi:hypothetical protein